MHWDQNIILIIAAAIIGISRLIARIAEEAKKQSRRRQPPPAAGARPEYTKPIQRTQPKTDEERVREFLEALGQPVGAPPPPKVQPRTQAPPRPLAPVQPPASMRPFAQPEFRTWKEREIVVLQQPTKPTPAKRVVAPAVLPAEANEPGAWMTQEQAEAGAAQKKETAPYAPTQPVVSAATPMLWKQILRSPDSLRTAVILREIFGPPRGLQAF